MDIDIDFADRNLILSKIVHIPASRVEHGIVVKHNTGVYLHSVPFIAEKNISAIPYDSTEKSGYFKIDFLNASMYLGIRNEHHLTQLMQIVPMWDLLLQSEFVEMLPHVNGHHALLKALKPSSVEQLAAVLAMIRPAKRHLIGKDWDTVFATIWSKPVTGEYYFKMSHAIAYAVAVIVQMNLICEQHTGI
jgi:hypothetical protein